MAINRRKRRELSVYIDKNMSNGTLTERQRGGQHFSR